MNLLSDPVARPVHVQLVPAILRFVDIVRVGNKGSLENYRLSGLPAEALA